jgi:hypothetical protein
MVFHKLNAGLCYIRNSQPSMVPEDVYHLHNSPALSYLELGEFEHLHNVNKC